jgi:hypothetical protein
VAHLSTSPNAPGGDRISRSLLDCLSGGGTTTSRASSPEAEEPVPRRPSNPVEYERESQSVALFNDAVFAIAMTLLVVGIRVPPGTTSATFAHALRGIGDSLESYVISFLVVGIYWLGNHRQVRFMRRFDGGALVINLLFLMAVAFIPFPSAMLNRYFGTASIDGCAATTRSGRYTRRSSSCSRSRSRWRRRRSPSTSGPWCSSRDRCSTASSLGDEARSERSASER